MSIKLFLIIVYTLTTMEFSFFAGNRMNLDYTDAFGKKPADTKLAGYCAWKGSRYCRL